MAVNLAKIRQDLAHNDAQIQTFALLCVTRLSPQLVNAPTEIRTILDKLKDLARSQNPDVVFLARKAINHLETSFKGELLAGAGDAGARPTPPVHASISVPVTESVPITVEPAITEPAPPPPPAPAAPAGPVGRQEAETMEEGRILDLLPRLADATSLANLTIALVKRGSPGCLEAVAPLLRHEDFRVRGNAVEVFSAHGGARMAPLILPLLKDSHNRVQGNALLCLARFGHEVVPRAFDAMLGSNLISMRESAVWALSMIEAPYAEGLLIRASRDPYEGVRLRAVKSLGKFLSREAVEGLKHALNDIDINICEAAAQSLRAIKAQLLARKDHARAGPVAAPAAAPAPLPPPPPAPAPAAAPPAPETAVTAPAPVPVPETVPEEVPPADHGEADGVPVPVNTLTGGNELLREAYREMGETVYKLCRVNAISHEILDGVFYELLRYQDFLRAYSNRKHDPDLKVQEAVTKLTEKIDESYAVLGKQASQLFEGKLINPPDKERVQIITHLERIRKAKRSGRT